MGLLSLVVLALVAASAIAPAFSQENAPAPAKEEAAQAKELSIYGEVQAVNAASNSITVQYYDYDSDEEKNIDITLGADTKIENANGINDIKKADWVDVTYEVSGGKNMAKTVSVEKEEEVPPEGAPAPKEAPEAAGE
jgi:hypothetical protein